MEDLIHLEEMFHEYGRLDGIEQGQKSGLLEGKVLGLEKGFDFAKEMGYYIAFSEHWISIVEQNRVAYPERTLKQLNNLLDLCLTFHTENNLNIDPLKLMNNVRGKFKAACSLLKVHYSYSDTQALNF
ncbi:hypothetical protein HK103_004695 [Boothiomyces macroporosus]|uniref:Essential protein Yae1 N-terminal domain-containing protein n=1 Tax=Boothiomyces macroporosus TaxID=261099 RepID=A0AAD5ULZ4_9FUNG|nr:hypothetical protein HK103_004695 [Boothiomyces macroporosus]